MNPFQVRNLTFLSNLCLLLQLPGLKQLKIIMYLCFLCTVNVCNIRWYLLPTPDGNVVVLVSRGEEFMQVRSHQFCACFCH